jgi:hypothetical protein
MSKPYFRQVPNFDYINRNNDDHSISNYVQVKNLFKRGKLRPDIFGNLNFFTKYKIIGDERPDNVAYKIYGDETLDWVILIANNILNIQTEWPLSQTSFDKLVLDKYGSYDELYSGIHHYETVEVKNSIGKTILPAGLKTPNTWRTNGNFIQAARTTINQIFAGSAGVPSKTVTVTMNNGIKGLSVGSQIYINNVSERVFNGRFKVTSVVAPSDDIAISFTYELPEVPLIADPILSSSGIEEAIFTIENNIGVGNAYYYEYYDNNFEQYVTLPSSQVIRSITNFEYENKIEEDKRNIFILKPRYLNVVFNDLDKIMPYKEGSTQYVSRTLKKGDNIRLYE